MRGRAATAARVDPRIHQNMIQLNMMDCRVKPGNDDVESRRLAPLVSVRFR
jgi:hypothetical protein